MRWGAPDDGSPACQNRAQVLAWYERGRTAGVRVEVSETVVAGDRILVGLRVTGRGESPAQAAGSGGETGRWQVLTVRGGRVVDIVGYDERSQAAARAGLTSGPGLGTPGSGTSGSGTQRTGQAVAGRGAGSPTERW